MSYTKDELEEIASTLETRGGVDIYTIPLSKLKHFAFTLEGMKFVFLAKTVSPEERETYIKSALNYFEKSEGHALEMSK